MSDEHTTPPRLYSWLDSRFNFKLDAAADANNAKCARYYSKENSGLDNIWDTDTFTFCNPPYSNVEQWVRYADFMWRIYSFASVLLVPVRTDRPWWHVFVLGGLCQVEWYRYRIHFSNSGKGAFMYNANLIFGPLETPIIHSIDARRFNDKKIKVQNPSFEKLQEMQIES